MTVTLRLDRETAASLATLSATHDVPGLLREQVTDVLYHLAFSAGRAVQRPREAASAWLGEVFDVAGGHDL